MKRNRIQVWEYREYDITRFGSEVTELLYNIVLGVFVLVCRIFTVYLLRHDNRD